MSIAEQASELYRRGLSQREIAKALGVSNKKVLQILVTNGDLQTDESKLFASGLTVNQIADLLGKKVKSVQIRIPYQKGIYKADEPTANALRIRKCRKVNK